MLDLFSLLSAGPVDTIVIDGLFTWLLPIVRGLMAGKSTCVRWKCICRSNLLNASVSRPSSVGMISFIFGQHVQTSRQPRYACMI